MCGGPELVWVCALASLPPFFFLMYSASYRSRSHESRRAAAGEVGEIGPRVGALAVERRWDSARPQPFVASALSANVLRMLFQNGSRVVVR